MTRSVSVSSSIRHSTTPSPRFCDWPPRLVSRQRLLVFSEALICLSYSGKLARRAEAPRAKLVVPAGNAPTSSGYQPGALLLSYETNSICGFNPNRRIGRKVTFSLAVGRILLLPRWWPRANARLLLTLDPEIGCQTWTRTKTNGLTDRRATLTPPGNGAAGRVPTCIVPFRRRMPHVFGHGSNSNWSERQDFHLRPPGPKPGALKTELHSEKMADPKGVAPSTLPQTTGRSAD